MHGADLMTRFLALLGCLMPIVVLYYVRGAMGAPPPHPQVCHRVPGALSSATNKGAVRAPRSAMQGRG